MAPTLAGAADYCDLTFGAVLRRGVSSPQGSRGLVLLNGLTAKTTNDTTEIFFRSGFIPLLVKQTA